MKALNQLIRKEIAESNKMKEISKDKDVPKIISFKIYKEIKEKDKKIDFYKKLNKAMREVN